MEELFVMFVFVVKNNLTRENKGEF